MRLLPHTGVCTGSLAAPSKATSDQGDDLSLFSSLRGGPATRAMDHWCDTSLGGSSFSWFRGGPARNWVTWVNKGKLKGRGPDVGPRLFRLPTLLLCCPRPLLTTGSEAPPVVSGCLIAATQLVALQVFHAVGASLYLDCVLRPGSQIRRGAERRTRLVRPVI
jgi:hypothetical protein